VVSVQTVSREVGYVSEMFASYQGEGARVGEKHLFVRFAGCNLRCRYCDTPDSLIRVPACEISFPGGEVVSLANPLSIADLAAIVARFFIEDPTIARLSLTGGEPMLQQRFIASWLRTAPPPAGCMLETAATVDGGLDDLLPHIATVSADIKLPSNSGEPPLWHHHRRFLAKCGRADVYLKMPVSDDTDEEQVRAGARLARETVPRAKLYLQPITNPENGAWQVGPSRLLALLAVAAAETSRVMVLPQMHKLLAIR
jgi:7-carboxy-7-deazaguanine synthase